MLIKLAVLKQQVTELANSLDCGGFVHLLLHVFHNNANLNASVQAQSSFVMDGCIINLLIKGVNRLTNKLCPYCSTKKILFMGIKDMCLLKD